jgi:hypothetical protein
MRWRSQRPYATPRSWFPNFFVPHDGLGAVWFVVESALALSAVVAVTWWIVVSIAKHWVSLFSLFSLLLCGFVVYVLCAEMFALHSCVAIL